MSDGSSNPETNPAEDDTTLTVPAGPSAATATAAASVPPKPFVRPPPHPQSFDPAAVFMEAYECSKINNSWNKVSSSLMIHPEWLTRIPEGRRWTMLHQIVFSGNVMHLNEVLALQISNPQFRLLCKTADNKTVREVAAERAHIHPSMIRRIERLVACDQLLNNAKDNKWELVKQFIRQQPDIVNEKPPYRRYYLAHHLAHLGELKIFKELSTICQFKVDLLADNKTVSQVAREHNKTEFAEYVENLHSESNQNHNTNQATSATSATTAPYPLYQPQYSPGFYDDPGITIIPTNLNLNSLFLPSNNASASSSQPPHHHPNPHAAYADSTPNTGMHFATHSLYQGPNSGTQYATHSLYQGSNSGMMTMTTTHPEDDDDDEESVQPKSNVPQMTDDEQAAYEKTVMDNIQKMSQQNLLNSITCCITKEILRDPVVAADGFTYEREAILNWFEHSNRSPQTNQELESTELKPNHAIKSILQLLQNADSPETKTVETSKASAK